MEIKTKQCIHCKEQINRIAPRCPKCGGKNYVWTTSKKIILVLILIIVALIFVSVFSGSDSSSSVLTNNQDTAAVSSADKIAVQKELDEIMVLAKKAGIVTGYEFSNKANVVYSGTVWPTQTVTFKKDFLAKVATLKKTITGYRHFEVRDAYSNEKMAEVTAFAGSLEVYK